MPITVERGEKMRNAYKEPLNKTLLYEAQQAIREVDPNDIHRLGRRIVELTNVRIDVQGQAEGDKSNLQLQLNGIVGKSTVATILAADTVTVGTKPPGMDPQEWEKVKQAREAEIQRKVRDAFTKSLDSFQNVDPYIYIVTGKPSTSTVESISEYERD